MLSLVVLLSCDRPSRTGRAPDTKDILASLPGPVIDAAYDSTTDRLLLASADALLILDPDDGAIETTSLSEAPVAIALHPDGGRAVIAHEGSISVLEVDPPSIVRTVALDQAPVDVLYAANDWVYAFPKSTDLGQAIACVGPTATAPVPSTGAMSPYVSGGGTAILHPDGDYLYWLQHVHPASIVRVNIASGAAVLEDDDPYHVEYDFDQPFAIPRHTDSRIVTVTGIALWADPTDTTRDLTFAGQYFNLTGAFAYDVTHAGDRMFTTRAGKESMLQVHNPTTGDFLGWVALPHVEDSASAEVEAYGRWVFVQKDDKAVLVVLEPSAATAEWSIARIDAGVAL